MNDPVPTSHARGPELPTRIRFDPGTESLPAVLKLDPRRAEHVLLVINAADDREWAADVAISVAGSWAREGRRVVLADLHIEEPLLHARLGEENLDGIVDVFLYGASLTRTARPVEGQPFYLISSGTYSPDTAAVLRHPRWEKIIAGFADAQASLILFIPADARGIESLSAWADSAVVLGTASAAEVGRMLPPGIGIRARIEAIDPREEARLAGWGGDDSDWQLEDDPIASAGAPLPEPTISVERRPREEVPHVDDEWAQARAADREDPLIGEYATGIPASTLPPSAARPPREPGLTEPPPPEEPEPRRARPRTGISPFLWLLLALTVVGAGVYLLLERNPLLLERVRSEIDRVGSGSGAAGRQPADPAPAAAAVARGVPLPYSVQVKAFASLSAARQLARSESGRFAEVPFYVSLEWLDEVPYYKVFAGASADTVQASRLRDRLVEAGTIDPDDVPGAWSLIQLTPLAFDFGERPSRPEAEARADSLRALEIPAYSLSQPYSDGSRRWRLYGGAFRDSTAAEPMRRLLVERNVTAPLVERTGSADGTP